MDTKWNNLPTRSKLCDLTRSHTTLLESLLRRTTSVPVTASQILIAVDDYRTALITLLEFGDGES